MKKVGLRYLFVVRYQLYFMALWDIETRVWYENPSGVVIRPDNSKHKYRWSG